MWGQVAGRGGGAHVRWVMSQRAVPEMIMQPMFPDGERNVARCTVAVAALVADVEVVSCVLELDALEAGVVTDAVVLVDVVTVTVFVCEPQAARTTATAAAPVPRTNARVPLTTEAQPTGRVGRGQPTRACSAADAVVAPFDVG